MQFSAEDRLYIEQTLTSFEAYRKKKLRSYKWFLRITKPFKIAYFIAIPSAVISAILPFLLPFFLPVILIGLGLFIFQIILYNFVFKEPDEKFRIKFKEEIMPMVFKKINPNFDYYPFKKFTEKRIKSMSLFKDSITRYVGEDYVKGKIQEVEMEFCEAFLWTEKVTIGSVAGGVAGTLLDAFTGSDGVGNDEGGDFSKQVKFFSGLVMEVDFHKSFSGEVFCVPKKYIDKGIFKKASFKGQTKKEVNNPDFDQFYSVFGTDEQLLHYVLTPALLEKFNKLRNDLNAEIFLSFINGKLNMGINWGRDLFECDFEKGIPSINDFLILL